MKKFFLLYTAIFFLTILGATALGNNFDFFRYTDTLNIDSLAHEGYDVYMVMNPGSRFGDPGVDNSVIMKYDTVSDIYSRFDKISVSSYMNISQNFLEPTLSQYHQKALFWGSTKKILTGVNVNISSQCSLGYPSSKCAIYILDNINNRWSELYSYAAGTAGSYNDAYNWYPYSTDSCLRTQFTDISSTQYPLNNFMSFKASYSVKFCGGTCSGCPISSSSAMLSGYNFSSKTFQGTELSSPNDGVVYASKNAVSNSYVYTMEYRARSTGDISTWEYIYPELCYLARKGLVFPENDRLYCINNAGDDIGVVYNLTVQSINDEYMTALSDSCSATLTDMDVITAIDCSEPTKCVIGGYHAIGSIHYSDLVYFNGSECWYIDNATGEYDTYNKTIFDIEYTDISGGSYIIAGDNMFGKFTVVHEPTTSELTYTAYNADGSTVIYSTRQCAAATLEDGDILDRVCNRSVYDNMTGYFYCDIDDMFSCPQGCMQLVMDLNTSETAFYSPRKSCTQVNTEHPSGISISCNAIDWANPSVINWILYGTAPLWLIPYSASCYATVDYMTIPSSECQQISLPSTLTDPSNIGHIFYTVGNCISQTIVNECSPENISGCYDGYRTAKCVYSNAHKRLLWNITEVCTGDNICANGVCTYIDWQSHNDTIGNPPIGVTPHNDREFWRTFFGSWADTFSGKLLIACIVMFFAMLISIIFFVILQARFQGQMPIIIPAISIGAIVFCLMIYFLAINFIPFWMMIILIVLTAAIIGIWIRRAAVGGG